MANAHEADESIHSSIVTPPPTGTTLAIQPTVCAHSRRLARYRAESHAYAMRSRARRNTTPQRCVRVWQRRATVDPRGERGGRPGTCDQAAARGALSRPRSASLRCCCRCFLRRRLASAPLSSSSSSSASAASAAGAASSRRYPRRRQYASYVVCSRPASFAWRRSWSQRVYGGARNVNAGARTSAAAPERRGWYGRYGVRAGTAATASDRRWVPSR